MGNIILKFENLPPEHFIIPEFEPLVQFSLTYKNTLYKNIGRPLMN